MTDVTTDDVKELRDATGLPIMECKEALTEADGNREKAIEILDEESEKAAAKKAGRDLDDGIVVSYVHNNGKVGAMIELLSETDFVARNEDFRDLGYEIAMHVAAMSPEYVSREDVPEEGIENKKDELREKFSDKPQDVQDDIIAGKMDDFYANTVLLEQPFVKDDEQTIEDMLQEATQTFGENVAIGQISRFEI
jgi:elongation factor Ts